MDYNEWLLDYYNLNIAPATTAASTATLVGAVAGAVALLSFGNIIFSFFSDSLFAAIIPSVQANFEEKIFNPTDYFLETTLAPFLAGYGLGAVGNIID